MLGRLLAALLLIGAAPVAALDERRVLEAAELASWPVWGVGGVSLRPDLDAIELREGADSAGVNLVSPEPIRGNHRIRLELKPLRREGVVVLLVGASPAAAVGAALQPPDDYRGGLDFWRDAVRGWAMALHTGFHQPDAFIAALPGWEIRARAPDPAPAQHWVRVEAGLERERVWLEVDGRRALETARDPGSAAGGYFALRLRGPGDGSFGCLVRRVELLPAERAD